MVKTMHVQALLNKVGESVTHSFSSFIALVKRWNRLPRAVVESLSLEVFKKCVDMALWDMV